MRILFLGDIVGKVGRYVVNQCLPSLTESFKPDFVVVNGENAAGGVGITADIVRDLLSSGVDGITLGNHAFKKREIDAVLEADSRIIRPDNFPVGSPGRGATILEKNGMRLGLINLCGRVFMGEYDDPFRAADRLIERLATPCTIVDFHAEATSEKIAFAYYVDGRVSAVLGTHTHVPTADETILPAGTAYISDVGMCGPSDGVIGMDRELILRRFLTMMPERFEVASGPGVISGVVVDVEDSTGLSVGIERVHWKNIT